MEKITPRKLQGFWELMPEEEEIFDNMISTLKDVFKANCFMPLDTPVAEYSDILLAKSGGDIDKEIYNFTKGSTELCLRYDLTVPLARFVAMNYNVLNFPFKRYQVGKVYRGERPQKGRFREFYQCDADVIGDGELPLTYDAECIKLYEPCFKALGFDATVEISNRKVLAGFFETLKGVENITDLMIIVDKVDKLKREDITEMFLEKGVKQEELSKIYSIIDTKGVIEKVSALKSLTDNETFQKGIAELEEVARYLKALNMPNYTFNLSIVRGHNYYTGTVFEVFIDGRRELGAMGGGGRYDNLCGSYIDQNMQGVGMSIGITRLFDAMKSEKLSENSSNITLGILTFDETVTNGLELVNFFRNNSVKADLIGVGKSFKAKMKEANRRNIPYILILGESELASKIYPLKNMRLGAQENLSKEEIVAKLSK